MNAYRPRKSLSKLALRTGDIYTEFLKTRIYRYVGLLKIIYELLFQLRTIFSLEALRGFPFVEFSTTERENNINNSLEYATDSNSNQPLKNEARHAIQRVMKL